MDLRSRLKFGIVNIVVQHTMFVRKLKTLFIFEFQALGMERWQFLSLHFAH